MNYGELKTQFLGLLKRRDITDAQADTFLHQAIQRVQRVLRIPPMEKSIAVTYDGNIFHDGEISIPADYLRLISITANDRELKNRDITTVLEDAKRTGRPTGFTRRGGSWKFGPTPEVGTVFKIDYYDEFSDLVAPSDTNYLSRGANDLVIYGALSYACDWFIDKRAATFEQRFNLIKQEIQDQADQDALMNAQVSSAYEFPED
jgi:hypothetical protein